MEYNFIGKTLAEIQKYCGWHRKGYSVFVLQDENDKLGKQLDEDFTISLILQKHPEYANSKIKYTSNYFGTVVLRVEKGGAE